MKRMTPEAAVELVRQRVFRIQTEWPGGGWTGTAFYFADTTRSEKVVLATARHVVEFPAHAKIRWAVERFDESGHRLGRLSCEHDESDPASRPHRYYKHSDVAFCMFPRTSETDGHLVEPGLTPLLTTPDDLRLTPATHVEWAGFPSDVESRLGRPTLCCFRGMVSAFHCEGSRGLYIVDGHAAPGVSGGPVWHYPEEREAPEVVGIVSQYWFGEPGLPGMCAFEPINPIITFLRTNYGPGHREA